MSTFEALLEAKREEVVRQWRARILGSYPDSASGGFKLRKDSSRNPIGSSVADGAQAVVDVLVRGGDRAEFAVAVDGIVRMRAVQSFTPSEAVAFVFDLESVLAEVLGSAAGAGGHERELKALIGRVNEVALAAFDVYLACREKIWELKAAMMRDRSYKLMERAGLLWEEDGSKDSSVADER